MTQLATALREVRAQYVREDYAEHVKQLFRMHLEELEPGAQIEDTLYFNHSAIPDFKLSWRRRGGSILSRDVFLRSSYASIVAADEPARIRRGDPIFLSISDTQVVDEPGFAMTNEDVARVARNSTYAMLTDAHAFDEIASADMDDTPISSSVRSNFMRGGRGLVDEPVAERLISAGVDGAVPLTTLIRESFSEDAVARMERTAQLVEWALDPDRVDAEALMVRGAMSTEEIRNVLPWVLRRGTLSVDSRFWSDLGSLFEFEQLEELTTELQGLDLSPLFEANIDRWTARRAYLGLNVSATGDPAEAQSGWRVDGGTFGLARGSVLVRVSNSGYRLKARPGSVVPRWTGLASRLSDYSVRSVSISGVERAVRVDARESSDVLNDVARLTESVSDRYFVDRVEVALRDAADEDGHVERHNADVDFAGGLIVAPAPVRLSDLARTALGLLGHEQDPNHVEEVDQGGSPRS
ncbi:hypothetical protein D8Y23_12815 [Microbacterium enclense]|uniref:Uncharacterized protein n=1 Tax=Microbacterium enclense TaxID=993073 RepID=A0A3S3MAT0_9MICO|nr:hypothetical protein [Microbacterium enclense]RWR16797.1 hypothetical protein D8Y23_12815 [Microbacterium enclense]